MNGYGSNTGTLERKLRAIYIRQAAADQVADLVDECNDYQIIFCAAAGGIIQDSKPTIEELSDSDLDSLYHWVMGTTHFNTWG
jgi:hypothetical protein